jgi:hypothetical protein
MARRKNPFPSSQFNIYLRDDYRTQLEKLAEAETDKLGVQVTAMDLVRRAVIDRYKLAKYATQES